MHIVKNYSTTSTSIYLYYSNPVADMHMSCRLSTIAKQLRLQVSSDDRSVGCQMEYGGRLTSRDIRYKGHDKPEGNRSSGHTVSSM